MLYPTPALGIPASPCVYIQALCSLDYLLITVFISTSNSYKTGMILAHYGHTKANPIAITEYYPTMGQQLHHVSIGS